MIIGLWQEFDLSIIDLLLDLSDPEGKIVFCCEQNDFIQEER